MPRGEHAKDPAFIKNRMEKRKKAKEINSKFFIKINDTLRVTRDKYNIILSKKMTAEETGNVYLMSAGFYNHPLSVVDAALKEGATAQEIDIFKKRASQIKTDYKNGILFIEAPADFVFDAQDVAPEPEQEEEKVED